MLQNYCTSVIMQCIITGSLVQWPPALRRRSHDAVMKRVDEQGRVISFSIFGVSRYRKDKPLEADLVAG